MPGAVAASAGLALRHQHVGHANTLALTNVIKGQRATGLVLNYCRRHNCSVKVAQRWRGRSGARPLAAARSHPTVIERGAEVPHRRLHDRLLGRRLPGVKRMGITDQIAGGLPRVYVRSVGPPPARSKPTWASTSFLHGRRRLHQLAARRSPRRDLRRSKTRVKRSSTTSPPSAKLRRRRPAHERTARAISTWSSVPLDCTPTCAGWSSGGAGFRALPWSWVAACVVDGYRPRDERSYVLYNRRPTAGAVRAATAPCSCSSSAPGGSSAWHPR